ncbi:hypothetical protein ABZP36_022706 [Zizania latifolia]
MWEAGEKAAGVEGMSASAPAASYRGRPCTVEASFSPVAVALFLRFFLYVELKTDNSTRKVTNTPACGIAEFDLPFGRSYQYATARKSGGRRWRPRFTPTKGKTGISGLAEGKLGCVAGESAASCSERATTSSSPGKRHATVRLSAARHTPHGTSARRFVFAALSLKGWFRADRSPHVGGGARAAPTFGNGCRAASASNVAAASTGGEDDVDVGRVTGSKFETSRCCSGWWTVGPSYGELGRAKRAATIERPI